MTDPLTPGGRHADWRPSPPGLVVLDVDGTLVGPGGGVSDAVVAAIAEAQAAGLRLGLATGRPYGGTGLVRERTGLAGPHITANGAVVVHDDEVLASWTIDPGVVTSVLEQGVAAGYLLEFYTHDGYLVTDEDPRRQLHADLLALQPTGLVRPGDDMPDIVKLAAVTFDGEAPGVVGLLQDHGLTAESGTSPATPGLTYVNATDPAADKGLALTRTAELLGLDLAATVAVGDGENDLSMLGVAGTSIAMGQAHAEVLGAAHLITRPVTEDGVVTALQAALAGWHGVPSPA